MVIRVDTAAVLFTAGCVLAASLVAGLLPAIQSSGVDLQSVMRSESTGATGFRQGWVSRFLVGGQVTLSCALLILCGMMIAGSRSLDGMQYAFDADGTLAGAVVLESFDYPDHESRMVFRGSVEEQLQALPGVEALAFTTNVPGVQGASRYALEGIVYPPDQALPLVESRYVSPSF